MIQSLSRRTVLSVFASALLLPLGAQAEEFPTRQIELIAPAQPGGGTDYVARNAAEAMRKYLPMPVVVINRPGASGSIAFSEVIRAKPDGYKIGMMIPETIYLETLGIGKVTHEDYQPLAQYTSDPASVTVRADAPWKTIEEFLAHVKANPEQIRVSNAGTGTVWHLAAAALEDKARLKFTHVPYQGSAPAFMALLAGQVEATTVAPGEMQQHIAAGKLRVLGIMGDNRIKSFESVPTLKEKGVDVVVNVFRGIGTHKDTPAPVVARLRQAFDQVGKDPEFKKKIEAQGMVFHYANGDAFKATMDRDAQLYRPLLQRLNLNKP